MKFTSNQRVRMKRTDNYGTVIQILPGDLVEIRFDDGFGQMSLPVEAIEAAEGQAPVQQASVSRRKSDSPNTDGRAAAQPGSPKRAGRRPRATAPATTPQPKSLAPPHAGLAAKPNPAPPPADKLPEYDDQTAGVQLAFDPQLDNEANPVAYELYLLNASPHKIVYELKIFTGSFKRWAKSGLLEGRAKKRLDVVEYRWLNEKLMVEADVRVVLTAGTGPRHFERMRVHGKTFFTKLQDVPALYRDAHLYTLFPTLKTDAPDAPPAQNGPSLKALTRQEALKRKNKKVTGKRVVVTDLAEKLTFPQTIDLHIDRLVEDPTTLARHLYLPTQLKAFDAYIDKAVRLGVDNVFIIHGVGDGILKRAIHSRLHRVKFVRDFRNEYHPKFGYGATEVTFD